MRDGGVGFNVVVFEQTLGLDLLLLLLADCGTRGDQLGTGDGKGLGERSRAVDYPDGGFGGFPLDNGTVDDRVHAVVGRFLTGPEFGGFLLYWVDFQLVAGYSELDLRFEARFVDDQHLERSVEGRFEFRGVAKHFVEVFPLLIRHSAGFAGGWFFRGERDWTGGFTEVGRHRARPLVRPDLHVRRSPLGDG